MPDSCIVEESPERIITKLKSELSTEQNVNRQLQEELQVLKLQQASLLTGAEAQEESITNRLIKKLEALKGERDSLVLKIEQEEEYLTNMLQKRLSAVWKEKVDLENQLEQEEEYIVNNLQRSLSYLEHENKNLRARIEELESNSALIKANEELQQLYEENQALRRELEQVHSKGQLSHYSAYKQDVQDPSIISVLDNESALKPLSSSKVTAAISNDKQKLPFDQILINVDHHHSQRFRPRSLSLPVKEGLHTWVQRNEFTKCVPTHRFSHVKQPIPYSTSKNINNSPLKNVLTRNIMKSGWMLYLRNEGSDPTKLLFVLDKDGFLHGYADDLNVNDSNNFLYSLNMDTVVDVKLIRDNEIILQTNDRVHAFHPLGEDATSWFQALHSTCHRTTSSPSSPLSFHANSKTIFHR